jgi:hypothetical protein
LQELQPIREFPVGGPHPIPLPLQLPLLRLLLLLKLLHLRLLLKSSPASLEGQPFFKRVGTEDVQALLALEHLQVLLVLLEHLQALLVLLVLDL